MSAPEHPSLDSDLIEGLTDLDTARGIASGCIRCDLALGRTQVVFGNGAAHTALMLVGEGPGEDEDIQGIPF
ncbi:MAG TPA: uracil-DNA glycosylase, partial [Armatimonadota bacterium]|nr:uracil-DNA glycosylase [Armatimonadota bacterium]